METPASSSRRVRAGLFEIDLSSGEVRKNGHKVPLQEQPFRVLAILVERPGEIVTREELQTRLWPVDTYVGFDDGLNTAIRKLRVAFGDSADNPRFIETVPRRGYRVIAPIQQIGEVVATTPQLPQNGGTGSPVATMPTPAGRRTSAVQWLLLFAPLFLIALALALVLGFNFRGSRDRLFRNETSSDVPTPAPALKLRKSLAVLALQNASKRDETAWLSTALAQMLSTELSAGEKLRIIPSENVARMERDLSLAETDTLASDTLHRVHQYLGGDFILVGSYTTLGKGSGGQLRLDVRLQDATTGETVASVAESGSEIKLFDLVSRVGSDLRRGLGTAEVAPVDSAGAQASYPASPEAARLYAQGVAKLHLYDSRDALALLQKVVSLAPRFSLAHDQLAIAWTRLGYDERARDEAKLAFELSGNLSREDRLLVEGRYREKTQDWPVAIEVYRNLVNFFPDNIEYGLQLANVQSRSGQVKDALATIAELRTLPPPQNQDPRIDLQQAYAMRVSGESQRMLAASVAAANQAASQGSRFLEAAARLSEGSAHYGLGEKQEALATWEKSRQLWASAGYPGEVAKTMNNIGTVQQEMGNLPEARKLYEQALAIWKDSGNQLGQMNVLANLANLSSDEGDLAGARQLYIESLAIAREVHATPDIAETLVEVGDELIALGDAAHALTRDLEAVELGRQFGTSGTLAETLARTARAFYVQGDLRSAGESAQQALIVARQIKDKSNEAVALTNWGEILTAQGDLPQARKNLAEALSIRIEIEEKSNAAKTRLQLAALSIEEGNATDAEHLARDVRDEFRREAHPDDEIAADAVLLRALQAQAKYAEAEKEAENAAPLLARSQNVFNRMAVRIVHAQIIAALGKQGEALKDLSIAARDSARCGFVIDQLEARLAHANIELRSGKTIIGHPELAAIRKDAAAKGIGLISQKASTLMTGKQHPS